MSAFAGIAVIDRNERKFVEPRTQATIRADVSSSQTSAKRKAKHASADRSPPWQETGTLDRATAAAFDRLGLAEYEAMETFRRMDELLRG